jgi:NAD(P)-dependent dehydrogenase (short-subunit alcohol dehydrogenase family)
MRQVCSSRKAFTEHETSDYDMYMSINRAIFFITRDVVRNMIEAGMKGAIVNVGSMWAQQAIGATPSSAYSMAKAGLHALTKNMAIELVVEAFGLTRSLRPWCTRQFMKVLFRKTM